jgi:hypothetical protein
MDKTAQESRIERLAEKFTEKLIAGLTPDEFVEVARRNTNQARLEEQAAAAGAERATAMDLTCASHDFCDANMVMLDAFEEVFGCKPDYLRMPINEILDPGASNTPDMADWNAAWTMARKSWPEKAVAVEANDIRSTIEQHMAEVPDAGAAVMMREALAKMRDQDVIRLRAVLQIEGDE